mmetsp:Transcript_32867/g.79175  ORF Transcript_32867/g.79175 Transcript_32867/m.79175 type:complete len:277 (-) Transcript_32867:475-1305(-)
MHVSYNLSRSSVHTNAILQLHRNIEPGWRGHRWQSAPRPGFVTTLHDHQLRLADRLIQRHRGKLPGGLSTGGRGLSCGLSSGCGRGGRRRGSGSRGLRRCRRCCGRRHSCRRRSCGRRLRGRGRSGGSGCCGRRLGCGRNRGCRGLGGCSHRRRWRLRCRGRCGGCWSGGCWSGGRCGGRGSGGCGGRRRGLRHNAAHVTPHLLQMQTQQTALLVMGVQALAYLVRRHQLIAHRGGLRIGGRRRCGRRCGRRAVRYFSIFTDADHVVGHFQSIHGR